MGQFLLFFTRYSTGKMPLSFRKIENFIPLSRSQLCLFKQMFVNRSKHDVQLGTTENFSISIVLMKHIIFLKAHETIYLKSENPRIANDQQELMLGKF